MKYGKYFLICFLIFIYFKLPIITIFQKFLYVHKYLWHLDLTPTYWFHLSTNLVLRISGYNAYWSTEFCRPDVTPDLVLLCVRNETAPSRSNISASALTANDHSCQRCLSCLLTPRSGAPVISTLITCK